MVPCWHKLRNQTQIKQKTMEKNADIKKSYEFSSETLLFCIGGSTMLTFHPGFCSSLGRRRGQRGGDGAGDP